MTVKKISYATMNCINPLYFIINKINGYIEKSNGDKYLTLVLTDKIKETLKSMRNYGTIYKKNTRTKKHENFYITIIVVRSVLHEVNKYVTTFLR